jgi:hypothetical protein
MRRRAFIAGLGTAAAWPMAAGARQPRARCLFSESGFANRVGCDSRSMLGNEASMDDTTLFGRSSGASACAVRGWRDDPLDRRGFGDQPVLRLEMASTQAGDRFAFAWPDRRSQTAGAVRGIGRLAARSLPVGAVHDARADGGTGRARHQDRSPRGLGVRAGRRPELQKKAFCRPSRIGRTSPASDSDGRPINIASTRDASPSSMRLLSQNQNTNRHRLRHRFG